jgi:broad specificity phosphatase PhoE
MIWIARHGLTDWDKERKAAGQSDEAQLTEEGIRHSQAIARIFGRQKIDAIVSSESTRAIKTALPLSLLTGVELTMIGNLAEMNFGDVDGKTPEFTGPHFQRRQTDLNYRFPNGESYNDVIKRVEAFLEWRDFMRYKRIFIVTHGGVIRVLLAKLLKIDLQHPQNLTTIDVKNEIVHILNTEIKKYSWIDTSTNERGKEIPRIKG